MDEPWVGNNVYTCQVEVIDIQTQTTSFTNLYTSLMYWVDSNGAFEGDNKIVFIYNVTSDALVHFEIYDIPTNSWTMGILSNPLSYYPGAFISSNNTVYMAGGSGVNYFSAQVWKLEF
jgi:hypothetical protein